MKYYFDITLIPNEEIPLHFLWEKLYQQLHLALVEIKDSDNKVKVGVAFPKYDKTQHQLGCKLRLLAPTKEILESLKINRQLSRLTDYVDIGTINNVPEKVERYAVFKRLQLKTNNARLARRKARREGINEEQALSYFQGHQEKTSRLPYIQIKSQSTGNTFRLMIDREETNTPQISDGFSCYGLSSTSSVPVFD